MQNARSAFFNPTLEGEAYAALIEAFGGSSSKVRHPWNGGRSDRLCQRQREPTPPLRVPDEGLTLFARGVLRQRIV